MSLSKHEIYVKALLMNQERMNERGSYGAKWNVVDEVEDLALAIEKADLTSRQRDVVYLLTQEYEQPEISEVMGIGQPRVHKHMYAAIRKIANIYEQWEALEDVKCNV
jgi:DNA-directed RNA polymerase specialized sigma24 family protein